MRMLLRLIFVPIFFISGLIGCSKIVNHANSLALECGISRNQAQSGEYLRILSPQSQALNEISSLALNVQFLLSSNGEKQNLKVSPRGCVLLPEYAGIVSISDKKGRTSSRYIHSPGLWGPTQASVQLIESPKIKANLRCPAEGVFGNDLVDQVFQFDVQGSLKPVQLRVYAYDSRNRTETDLFVKKFSQESMIVPAQLELSTLAEGVYKLRASVEDNGDGFEMGERPLTPNESCNLFVIRTKPFVSRSFPILTGTKILPVFSPGDKLPWHSNSVDNDLFGCRENHTEALDSASCVPRSECQKPENYKKVLAIEAKDTGIYDYFAFVKDKAGNAGELDCQTVAVSNQSPTIELRWARKDWNTDGGESADLPYATLEAEAFLNHKFIQPKQLESRLECKIDFLLQGRDVLKGENVRCLNGRCAGLSMGEFVPCDTSIQFDIHKAWQQKSIQFSQLRLTVRTNDGAGHFDEESIRLWINSSRWPIRPVKSDLDLRTWDPWVSVEDKAGHILLTSATSGTYLVKDEQWTLPSIEGPSGSHMKNIVKTKDGEIFGEAYTTMRPENPPLFIGIMQWSGKSWVQEKYLKPTSDSPVCRHLYQSNSTQLLCGMVALGDMNSQDSNSIATLGILNRDGWTFMSGSLQIEGTGYGTKFFLSSTETVWMYAKGQMYFRSLLDSEWTTTVVTEFSEMFEDRKSQMWLTLNTGSREYSSLQKFNGRSFEKVELPPSTQPLRDNISLSPAGDVTFGAYIWSLDATKWSKMPHPKEIDQDIKDFYPFFDNRGHIWWFDQSGLIGTLNNQLVYLPLNISGLSCFDEGSQCAIFVTGPGTLILNALQSQGFNYGTFVFKIEDFSVYNVESMGLPPTKDISDHWMNGDQSIELSFSSIEAPTYRLKNGTWVAATKHKIPLFSTANRAPDGTLFYIDQYGVQIETENDWENVYYKPGVNFYSFSIKVLNCGGKSVIREMGSKTYFSLQNGQVLEAASPDDKLWVVVDGEIWGLRDNGIYAYDPETLNEIKHYEFSDIGITQSASKTIFPLNFHRLLVKLNDGGHESYVLINTIDGSTSVLDFPFESPTTIENVISNADGDLVVRTNYDIYLYKNSRWKTLITGAELKFQGYIGLFYSMFMDNNNRLWLHQPGIFFRYDFNRSKPSFY